jgi:hypothetical protein
VTGESSALRAAIACLRGGAVSLAAFVAVAASMAAPRASLAADERLRIEAQLDRTHVAVGEEAQVTVIAEARGVNLPDYALAAVPGLRILRVANSQSFSWVNGRLSRSTTSVFLVSASAPGRYTIPPVAIASGGARAQTQPLVLEVGGSASQQPGTPGAPPGEAVPPRVWGDESLPELFVRLVVDHRRVYWNQQVTARFVLYARDRLEEIPMWEVAEAGGFWKESLGEMKRGRVRVGNEDYIAYEQDVAYFPTRTGQLTLGPGRIEARIERTTPARSNDPFSIFGFPETHVETIPLQTENASVTVLPLPGGAPPGFRGAVGKLAMDVKVDRLVARAGEPVTVVTVLRGRGNLNTAGDPDVSASLPLRSFESPGSVASRNAGFEVSGERRHEKAFVPEVPGSFVIEPIRFSWFDPEEGRFYTQVSDSIRIRVGAGSDSTLAGIGPAEPPAAPRGRRGPRGSLSLGPPVAAAGLGAGSLVALAGAALVAGARRRVRLDPKARRRSELERLARGIAALSDSADAPAVVGGKAAAMLGEALGLRYGADVEGRPREETLRLSREAGADEEAIESARRLLESLERLAFAPASAGAGREDLAAARAFVERLAREAA